MLPIGYCVAVTALIVQVILAEWANRSAFPASAPTSRC